MKFGGWGNLNKAKAHFEDARELLSAATGRDMGAVKTPQIGFVDVTGGEFGSAIRGGDTLVIQKGLHGRGLQIAVAVVAPYYLLTCGGFVPEEQFERIKEVATSEELTMCTSMFKEKYGGEVIMARFDSKDPERVHFVNVNGQEPFAARKAILLSTARFAFSTVFTNHMVWASEQNGWNVSDQILKTITKGKGQIREEIEGLQPGVFVSALKDRSIDWYIEEMYTGWLRRAVDCVQDPATLLSNEFYKDVSHSLTYLFTELVVRAERNSLKSIGTFYRMIEGGEEKVKETLYGLADRLGGEDIEQLLRD